MNAIFEAILRRNLRTFWFPVGGAWLARHIWEAYLFSMDKEFLTDNFNTILEAAVFWVDAFVEDERDGTLVSSPSWSPEHGPYSLGCTQDQAIIWDVFNITLKASAELGIAIPEIDEIRSAQSRYHRRKLGWPASSRNGKMKLHRLPAIGDIAMLITCMVYIPVISLLLVETKPKTDLSGP